MKAPVSEAFLFQNSVPEPNSGCWLWAGKTANTGYARFHHNRRDYQMHRVACEVAIGRPMAPGTFACHRCDVRSCVNPAHVYEGTFYDNMRDMARSGSQKGPRNPSARLSPNDVIAIRADARLMKEIAADYGVHPGTIQAIKSGRSWTHVR